MSNITDFARESILKNIDVINSATGIISLDALEDTAYVINQGTADLTIDINNTIDTRAIGYLKINANQTYTVSVDASLTIVGGGSVPTDAVIYANVYVYGNYKFIEFL